MVTALAEDRVDGLRFVGMGIDGMVDLLEQSLLADGGPAIESPDLVGSRRLMGFAHENPVVAVFPSSVAHCPQWLATHAPLVSVNAAVEVDLYGQVNSEVVSGREIAGIGGSIDFVEAATHSAGGLRIIALPSTTRDGGRTDRGAPGTANAVVTIARGMVDIVATEHGITQLEGKTNKQRAEALIGIAAPQHRQDLLDALRQVVAI